ncbi:MAG: 16S rRNA (cytidine(1402)-2'-O)-methyltransferase [Betaproteobacteria bacterium]|nr:16S rRNA (cytidine(1402)-2'-O)-methyltransferase [Betaproteobacteria bacterium]
MMNNQQQSSFETHKPQHFPNASLLVVATPIGNLSDLSPRAALALQQASLIACEDSRVSRKLFDMLGIRPSLVSVEQHREIQAIPLILAQLHAGKTCALISDAGTPAISDPGYRVVRAAREAGFVVIAIPGPSAFVALSSISGFTSGPIWFEGFLPQREKAASARLAALLELRAHIALYEAPHRIAQTARLLAKLAPSRQLCLGRELTKRFEESAVMTAQELPSWLELQSNRDRSPESNQAAERGLDDETPDTVQSMPAYNIQGRTLLEALLGAMGPAQAARLAQRLTQDRNTDWYQMALTLKKPV